MVEFLIIGSFYLMLLYVAHLNYIKIKTTKVYIFEDYLYHVRVESDRVHKRKPYTIVYASLIDRSTGEKYEKVYQSLIAEPLSEFVDTVINDYLFVKEYQNKHTSDFVKEYENKYSGDIDEN